MYRVVRDVHHALVCASYLQLENGEVGKEIVGAIVELLRQVVVQDVEVLWVVSVDARDELLDVLGSRRGRDPLRCAGGFRCHDDADALWMVVEVIGAMKELVDVKERSAPTRQQGSERVQNWKKTTHNLDLQTYQFLKSRIPTSKPL